LALGSQIRMKVD